MHRTLPNTLKVPMRSDTEYGAFLMFPLKMFRDVHFTAIDHKETVVDVAL